MLSRCLLFTLFLCIVLLCHAEVEKKILHCLRYLPLARDTEVTISNDEKTTYCAMRIVFIKMDKCKFDTPLNLVEYEPQNEKNLYSLKPQEFHIGTTVIEGIRYVKTFSHNNPIHCEFVSQNEYAFHGFDQFRQLIRECSRFDENTPGQTNEDAPPFSEECIKQLLEDGVQFYDEEGPFHDNYIEKMIDDHKRGNVTTTVDPKILLDDDDEEYKGKLMEFNEIETTTEGSIAINRSLLTVAIVGLILIAIQ